MDGIHTETYPDTERIKGSGIGVIALTGLKRSLIQVEHNGVARKEKQHEHDDETAVGTHHLIGKTDQT